MSWLLAVVTSIQGGGEGGGEVVGVLNKILYGDVQSLVPLYTISYRQGNPFTCLPKKIYRLLCCFVF